LPSNTLTFVQLISWSIFNSFFSLQISRLFFMPFFFIRKRINKHWWSCVATTESWGLSFCSKDYLMSWCQYCY
jgi:hypothetical protein